MKINSTIKNTVIIIIILIIITINNQTLFCRYSTQSPMENVCILSLQRERVLLQA